MAHLYPSLHDRFKSEGICPICLTEMAHTPRFSCDNSHTICHRCRPYYYSCPQCLQPLNEMPPCSPGPYDPPPPSHFMPHPPYLLSPYPPSAPQISEFHEHESNWQPPSPPREHQELIDCPYTHLGCTAKFVPLLRDMHVSRCQYKHHSAEEEEPPREMHHPDQEVRLPCRYQSVGCNVRAPHWRLNKHEELCIYKDRAHGDEALENLGEHLEGSCRLGDDDDDGEPNRMVACRYRQHGCMVRMPRWRKETHESKCNHATGEMMQQLPPTSEMMQQLTPTSWQEMRDPEEQVDCRWAEHGCRVRPRYAHRRTHEAKCNYRMEECAYRDQGCEELLLPARKFAHESSCGYAY